MSPEHSPRHLEKEYLAGLQQLPELIELCIYDIPRPLDPESLGIDNCDFDQLSPQQLKAAKKAIFKHMEIDTADPFSIVRKYTSRESPEAAVSGPIGITVYKTKYSGFFLQELTFQDNRTYFMFGPDQDI